MALTKVEQLVVDRDQGRCAKCGRQISGPRGFAWSIHHRRPRGMGGTRVAWVNAPANLVLLCGSGVTGCHGWVELNRAVADRQGFLISRIGRVTASMVPIRHALLGAVLLDNEGSYSRVPNENRKERWV